MDLHCRLLEIAMFLKLEAVLCIIWTLSAQICFSLCIFIIYLGAQAQYYFPCYSIRTFSLKCIQLDDLVNWKHKITLLALEVKLILVKLFHT